MRTFWSDLRLGLRMVLTSPTASLVAIIALGLGNSARGSVNTPIHQPRGAGIGADALKT